MTVRPLSPQDPRIPSPTVPVLRDASSCAEPEPPASPVVDSVAPPSPGIGDAPARQPTQGAECDVACQLLGGALGPTLRATTRAVVEELEYDLKRTASGRALAQRLNLGDLAPVADPATLVQPRAAQVRDLHLHLERSQPLGWTERNLLAGSMETTRRYLGLDARPTVQPEVLHARPAPADARAGEGFSTEVAEVALQDLRWKGVSEYADSRLGPVVPLLDSLGPRDRIRFSNVAAEESLDGLGPVDQAARLNLPISSWTRDLDLLQHPDGTRTLLVSRLPGKDVLRHYQLMVRRHLLDRPDPPAVSVLEADSAYEPAYDQLRDFFRQNADRLGPVDAVTVGYARAFGEAWRELPHQAVSGPESPWSADVYTLPDARRVAVLRSTGTFQGEILGQALRRLVQDQAGIRHVFVAGSGGSLHVRDPYSMVFPDRVAGVPNVLSSGTEQMVHESVVSPLVETPAMLREAMARGATTLDMEMAHVADALKDLGVEVGVSVLATDFPVDRSFSPEAELTRQDPTRKYAATHRYARAVFNYLTRGQTVLEHPLERHLDCTLEALSRSNLQREVASMGRLSPEEAALLQRLADLEPHYSFRMTTARVRRVLEDGVLLSTGQVSRLLQRPVSPYTPAVEDRMYGAFDYTFGALGFSDGDARYGDVEVRLRPEVWKARSWASFASGWHALSKVSQQTGQPLDYGHASPSLLTAAREQFAQGVAVPRDYKEIVAAGVIRRMRDLPAADRQELLQAPSERLPALLEKHQLWYLEGKIQGALNLQDIEQVTVPADFPAALVDRCRDQGIRVVRADA